MGNGGRNNRPSVRRRLYASLTCAFFMRRAAQHEVEQ